MLKASAIFKDGMVLQRDSLVSLFGETDCKCVEVSFAGKKYEAEISEGRWLTRLETADSGQNLTMTIAGGDSTKDLKEQMVINDILLGDVWLAGGQSNMELEIRNSEDGEKVAAAANYDLIRFYNVPKIPADNEELAEAEKNTAWSSVKGDACRYMSAVAYYFATRIHKETGVPIGIIDCYWGGTSATCWVDRETLKDILEVAGYIDEWDEICNSKTEEQYDEELNEYNDRIIKWQAIEAEVKRDNPAAEFKDVRAVAGDWPWPPPKGAKAPFRPFGLHNTMIGRVSPYTIKGIIYYQGEEDGERASYYSKLNGAVVKQWRNDFTGADKDEPIPFYITQLPMFINDGEEDNRGWGELRRQQEMCSLECDNTHIAVIIDCGEYDNIHPTDKKTPGNRLAEQALEYTYKHEAGLQNLKIFQSVFKGNTCEITFENTYSALCYKPTDEVTLTSKLDNKTELADGEACGDRLFGFEISSDGKTFYKPDIVALTNRLVIYGKEGSEITDVRYGWFNYGAANVYSMAGLPLMPFWIKND